MPRRKVEEYKEDSKVVIGKNARLFVRNGRDGELHLAKDIERRYGQPGIPENEIQRVTFTIIDPNGNALPPTTGPEADAARKRLGIIKE